MAKYRVVVAVNQREYLTYELDLPSDVAEQLAEWESSDHGDYALALVEPFLAEVAAIRSDVDDCDELDPNVMIEPFEVSDPDGRM